MVEKLGSCEPVRREISNYVDGEIDASLRTTMEEHFSNCRACASLLAGTRNVVTLYGDDRMLQDLPAGFSRRLEKRLARNVASSKSRWPTWSTWLIPVMAIALIAGTVTLTNSLSFKHYLQSRHAQPGNNVPPEMMVVVSDGSKLFHVPGCPFIHDKATERTITAREATQDGYTPCTRCLRQYLKTGLVQRLDNEIAHEEADEEQGETLGAVGR